MQQVIESIPLLHIRKWNDYDIEYLFKIAYYCALRLGEACKLSVKDFDLDDRFVYLGQTKTNKNDKRVIPKEFIEELELYLVNKQGDLFPGLTVKTIDPWLRKLGVWCDVEAWTTPQSITGEKTKCHIFRKSRGKDYEKMGKNPSTIMQIYGHKSLNTTSNYLRNSMNRVKDEI